MFARKHINGLPTILGADRKINAWLAAGSSSYFLLDRSDQGQLLQITRLGGSVYLTQIFVGACMERLLFRVGSEVQ